MIINVTNKPEGVEGETYCDELVVDQGGLDLRFNDGRVYSANYGEHLPEDVAMAIIEADFEDSGWADRQMIVETLRHFVDKLARKCT